MELTHTHTHTVVMQPSVKVTGFFLFLHGSSYWICCLQKRSVRLDNCCSSSCGSNNLFPDAGLPLTVLDILTSHFKLHITVDEWLANEMDPYCLFVRRFSILTIMCLILRLMSMFYNFIHSHDTVLSFVSFGWLPCDHIVLRIFFWMFKPEQSFL